MCVGSRGAIEKEVEAGGRGEGGRGEREGGGDALALCCVGACVCGRGHDKRLGYELVSARGGVVVVIEWTWLSQKRLGRRFARAPGGRSASAACGEPKGRRPSLALHRPHPSPPLRRNVP